MRMVQCQVGAAASTYLPTCLSAFLPACSLACTQVKEVALRPQGRGPLLAALAITCDGSGSAAGGGAGPGAKRGEVALVSANARTLVASVPVHAPVWSCAWSRRCDHTVGACGPLWRPRPECPKCNTSEGRHQGRKDLGKTTAGKEWHWSV